MDEELIYRWNQTVLPEDIVFHLGDFCKQSNPIHYASRLQGTIYLVPGNWDKPRTFRSTGINILKKTVYLNNLILTHIPLKNICDNKVNIHGHLHTIYLPGRYINVSADLNNFTPIPLETILQQAQQLLTI